MLNATRSSTRSYSEAVQVLVVGHTRELASLAKKLGFFGECTGNLYRKDPKNMGLMVEDLEIMALFHRV